MLFTEQLEQKFHFFRDLAPPNRKPADAVEAVESCKWSPDPGTAFESTAKNPVVPNKAMPLAIAAAVVGNMFLGAVFLGMLFWLPQAIQALILLGS